MVESLLVHRSLLIRIKEKSFDFRGKDDTAVMNAVTQWLDANAIADKPELAIACVPQGNGKHPPESVDAVDPPLLEGMQYDFRIRMVCLPAMIADIFQFGADVGVVVDLAIENYPTRNRPRCTSVVPRSLISQ